VDIVVKLCVICVAFDSMKWGFANIFFLVFEEWGGCGRWFNNGIGIGIGIRRSCQRLIFMKDSLFMIVVHFFCAVFKTLCFVLCFVLYLVSYVRVLDEWLCGVGMYLLMLSAVSCVCGYIWMDGWVGEGTRRKKGYDLLSELFRLSCAEFA
jgi:hypothetical protein